MTLTEIMDTFKNKFNPSKIMNSFERTTNFYDESDNYSGGNDSGEDLKSDSVGSSVDDSVKISNAVQISQNGEDPLIKLTNVWKT
jgi:putative ABC transport system ATP-binding protein